MSKTLATNVTVEGDTYKAGTVPPAEVAAKIDHPRAYADAAKSDAAPEPDPDKGYAGQSPDELKAEVEKRDLTVTGTGKDGNVLKGDLVAALEADDAAKAS